MERIRKWITIEEQKQKKENIYTIYILIKISLSLVIFIYLPAGYRAASYLLFDICITFTVQFFFFSTVTDREDVFFLIWQRLILGIDIYRSVRRFHLLSRSNIQSTKIFNCFSGKQ